METIHRLMLNKGIEIARRNVDSVTDRRAVEAAAAVMADEAARIGITHAGFVMTALPHRRVEDHIWRRESPRATLLVESGHDRQGVAVGVPYGSLARLILLYLQTEAVRTGSPEVELGRSMNAWLGRMQIAGGGRTRTLVAEQARRISACRLTFFTDRSPGVESRHNGAFVRDAISLSGRVDKDQPSLWQDRVRLDEGYFASLTAHPVPVREEAIRAIGSVPWQSTYTCGLLTGFMFSTGLRPFPGRPSMASLVAVLPLLVRQRRRSSARLRLQRQLTQRHGSTYNRLD